ncbi:S-glutathionyl-(chloro)hydroquinone reductase [Coemansia sp. RSA 1972]|nr:S-glutathionyl-(chloro)hydroquinone reductase [Coemansia sp. RSA 1972]
MTWLQQIPDTLVVIVLTTAISWVAKLGKEHGVVIFGKLVVLGVSNAVGSVFRAYLAFGSLSRSKLNDRVQAKSQLSGVVTASLVVASLLGLLPYLFHLPHRVLAAIISDAVISLLSVTPGAIAFLFKVQAWSDLFLLLFICFCSVAASVETGILLAVIISLVMVIKSSSSNDSQDESRLQSRDNSSRGSLSADMQAQHIEELLYFANAGQLHAWLNWMEMYGDMRTHPSEALCMNPTRAVVFDLVGMSDIDGSALEILLSIVHEYSCQEVCVLFVCVPSFVEASPDALFPAEVGHYHLYVSYVCLWAHHTLIVCKLKGLESIISMSVVHYLLGPNGWEFVLPDEVPGATLDHINGAKYICEVYFKAEPEYSAWFMVPVLWDKKKNMIVSNESSEIICMLNTAFDKLIKPDLGHFKCNIKQIATDYPNILWWTCEIYQLPGIKEMVNMDHIKKHYYMSHPQINLMQVVPLNNGPDLNNLVVKPTGRPY